MQSTTRPASSRVFPRLSRFEGYVAAALGLVALFALSWFLRDILLLTFGAIVMAAVIRAVARPLISRFPQRERLSVLVAILGLLVIVGGLFWLFGHQIGAQLRDLGARLPQAVASVKDWMQQNAVGRYLLEQMQGGAKEGGGGGGGLGGILKAAGLTLDSLGHALLMLVAGIYLALTPSLYRDGLVRLFPLAQRPKLREALDDSGVALQKWLLGQSISMLTIGVLTTLGLWAVGCPAPLALGILAGLLVFVPVIGFLVAFVPVVLMALSDSTQTAVAAVIVFLVVQQLEEQLVQPLAQKWAASLPPALGLLSLAAAGALFGLPGMIFGCPLTVVIIALVKKLYLEHGIERRK